MHCKAVWDFPSPPSIGIRYRLLILSRPPPHWCDVEWNNYPMSKAPEPLRRIATILDAVGFSRDGLSSSGVAELTGLPMPTVHRTLRNLVALGYIENSGLGTAYRLGERLRRLAKPGLRNEDVAELARPILQRLADTVGCVAGISRQKDFTSETVVEILPRTRNRSLVLSGKNLPPHATAAGKIFLSALEPAQLDDFLAQELEACRPATIVDPDELRSHLDLVRKRGYATCRDECDPGVYAVAVPISLPRQGLLLALGVVDLRERLFEKVEEDELLQLVRGAGQELTARLSGLDAMTSTDSASIGVSDRGQKAAIARPVAKPRPKPRPADATKLSSPRKKRVAT